MKAILSFALVAWFFGLLFFVNKAKTNYCGLDSGIVQRPNVEPGVPVIAFDLYSYKPDTSVALHFLRDSLRRQLQQNDKLKIIGHFTQKESDVDSKIGLKRANAIRALFDGYVNLNSIEIDARLSDRISTTPTFEILRKERTQNTLETEVPPMMENRETVEPNENQEIGVANESPNEESFLNDSNRADYVVYFDDDSSEMIDASEVQQYIDSLSKRIKKSNEIVEISGYDDNTRTSSESLALAKRRTWRVRKAFSDTYVRRRQVTVKNEGQINPIETNDTPEGRSKNRRVEIRIRKN